MSSPSVTAPMASLDISSGVESSPFPVASKRITGLVNGVETDVECLYFADKIVFTISQGGRLSQWARIQVPLSSASPTSFDTALPVDNSDMLPLNHLTAKTLLGAGGDQRETVGHLYASQIASAIATRSPEEMRTILVGFGFGKVDTERETFFDLMELVHKVI